MPKETYEAAMFCPLQGVIDIVSKKWALLVINEIGNHRRIRFGELKSELRGITSKTLTNTLDDLRESRLVVREAFNEIPPRVEYSLTRDGIELHHAVIPLLRWASSREGAVVTECSCKALKLQHSKMR
jgi:DNA-binding HxlR family transcriptional regulator